MSINTEKIDCKLIYLIRKPKTSKMEPNKNLDDLIINLKPKVIRFHFARFDFLIR